MLASVWQRRASADPVLQTFHVRQLTLSQTVKRNALSNELITALALALALALARRDAALDPGVRCMVIFRREHLVFGRS
jgi:enoyl-CoA hydratase/carnithine racemase